MRISDWSSDVCSSDLLPKIFSLQKLGGGNDRANGAHATQRPQALIHQCPGKGDGVLSVRIPVAIQGGEARRGQGRSEEHTSELQSLMRISYAVFCLKKKNNINKTAHTSKKE